MAEYLGVVKLGTFYHNSSPLSLPNRPWYSGNYPGSLSIRGNGDIPQFSGSMSDWVVGDTNSSENKKLKWVKIKDANKTLLICTINILNKVEWDTLDSAGYITGKKITLDGQDYLCRVLTGGNYYRSGSDRYSGGQTTNEWDRFIVNEDNIDGLVKPTSSDLDSSQGYDDLDREHNQLWHWWGNRSWCKETYKEDSYSRVLRGFESPRCFTYNHSDYTDDDYGWRPVLEVLNSAPNISDEDSNLRDKNTGFSINYTISDIDNDNLTVIEKLNNTILRTLSNAPKDETLTIEVTNEMLYKLPLNQTNKIQICVNDGKGGIAYRNYTFTRTNTAPIINGQDKNLGLVDRTVKQSYRVHDEENNDITVVEKIDGTIIKTFRADSNKEYTIEIPANVWILLRNGQHKLTVNATDSNNATSIRTYTFTKKETKIDLTLKNVLKTDDRANKILITPVWQGIENANVKVEVCNNANDKEPTWEDCTKPVLANQHYNFTNGNKMADTWGINIKFNIEKKDKVEEEIYFNGFGGAFE